MQRRIQREAIEKAEAYRTELLVERRRVADLVATSQLVLGFARLAWADAALVDEARDILADIERSRAARARRVEP